MLLVTRLKERNVMFSRDSDMIEVGIRTVSVLAEHSLLSLRKEAFYSSLSLR